MANKVMFLVMESPETVKLLELIFSNLKLNYLTLDFVSTRTLISDRKVEFSLKQLGNDYALTDIIFKIEHHKLPNRDIILVHLPMTLLASEQLVKLLRLLAQQSEAAIFVMSTFTYEKYKRYLLGYIENNILYPIIKRANPDIQITELLIEWKEVIKEKMLELESGSLVCQCHPLLLEALVTKKRSVINRVSGYHTLLKAIKELLDKLKSSEYKFSKHKYVILKS